MQVGASNPYEAPTDDGDEDNVEDDSDDAPSSGEPPQHWYTVSLARVLVGTLVGGWLYQTYWMFHWWSAYRQSEGYSRAPFWRAVRERTGFQINPTWRALL